MKYFRREVLQGAEFSFSILAGFRHGPLRLAIVLPLPNSR
jgi:hypothetical protein